MVSYCGVLSRRVTEADMYFNRIAPASNYVERRPWGPKVEAGEIRQEIMAIIQAREDGVVNKGENKGKNWLH